MKQFVLLIVILSLTGSAAFAQSSQPISAQAAQLARTMGSQGPVKRDSVIQGLLIGAGAGIAAAVMFTRYNCGPGGSDKECEAIAAPVGAAIFIPAGMIVGGLIDRAIGNDRVSVMPVFSPKGAGFSTTINFGR